MKSIILFATKGGVGKTTVSVMLGKALAREEKVLLVELDRNFSLSSLLGIKGKSTIYDVVHGEGEDFYEDGNLTIIPADGRVFKLEQELTDGKISLENLWVTMKKYPFVVVDSHNSFTPLTVSILRSSDVIIVPFTPDRASAGAYFHTDKVLKEIVKDKPVRGLANRVRRGIFGYSKEDMKYVDLVRKKGEVFRTILPEGKRRPVFEDRTVMKYVENLVEEVKEVM